MSTQHTFTYRHSEMPPMTDEMKSEIAEIDFNVANLILKFQGNYRALCELAETLAGTLNDCEMNMQCIRIIPDDGDLELLPRAISMTDLSAQEKHTIVSNAISLAIAIGIIANIFNCSLEQASDQIAFIARAEFEKPSPDDVDKLIKELVEAIQNNPDGGFLKIQL